MNGIVKEYDKQKGFGFISGEDGEDYFVHVYGLGPKLKQSALRSWSTTLYLILIST
jgi:hypothetical protein